MKSLQRFSGQVVIVTGASQGIGQAVAEAFAREGAHAVLVARRGADRVASGLEAEGWSASSWRCDVSIEPQVQALVADVAERHGRVDVLVNNAAINQVGRFSNITLEDWERVLRNNLTSQFICCRAVVPIMRKRRRGRIVNVSSIAGRFRSEISGIHYVTSKAGIIGFTRQLAFELASEGISVNAVCPSQTATPMLGATLNPDSSDAMLAKIPLGRMATPEEQANVVLFLASSEASYMTGAVVDVNGGQW